jgi:CDP-diacylglycerol---glycerol-3-phosphate 3-phosphatidyltransferase
LVKIADVKTMFTTPNVLTLCRIATVPLIVYLLLFTGPIAAAAAAAVFFVATITDFLDGYIARSYGSGTNLGKFLDPLADKLIVMAALVMLTGMPRNPHVPAWMVVVLVSRELVITGLRAIAAVEGKIIAADELGKYKMVLQCIAIQGLLIHYTYLHIEFFAAGMFMLWIAMVVSVWSALDYIVKARDIFTARPHPTVAKCAAAR